MSTFNFDISYNNKTVTNVRHLYNVKIYIEHMLPHRMKIIHNHIMKVKIKNKPKKQHSMK